MPFFSEFSRRSANKKQHYKWRNNGKSTPAAWYERHNKILKHAGVGGKSHTMEKGHITWNRKGRW